MGRKLARGARLSTNLTCSGSWSTSVLARLRRVLVRVAVCIGAWAANSPGARAQSPVDSGRARWCAATAGRLQTSTESLHREVGALDSCPALAPNFLPALWRRPLGNDTVRLNALLEMSRSVRDRRLVAALRATAGDSSRSMADRDAALIVLAANLDPAYRGSAKLGAGGKVSITLSSWMHPYQKDGVQPTGPADLQAIFEIFVELAKLKPTAHTGDAPWIGRIVVQSIRRRCQDAEQRRDIRYCPPPQPEPQPPRR